MKDVKNYLSDMLFSIGRIEKLTEGIDEASFEKNLTVQDAVIRRLAVIGEAANKIPKGFRTEHEGVDWRGVVDMRNFLIHEYFEIDLKVVWDTIKLDLPKLKAELSKTLENA